MPRLGEVTVCGAVDLWVPPTSLLQNQGTQPLSCWSSQLHPSPGITSNRVVPAPWGQPSSMANGTSPALLFQFGKTLKGCPSSQGFPGFGQGTRRTYTLLSFSLCPILFPSLPCRYFKVLPSYTLPNKSSSESASSTKVNL